MIPITQLLYKIDQRLNKLSSTAHQSIPDTDKILALNEAQIKLIKKKVDTNNNYGIHFDGFRKRYQDLQHLVMPHEELPATVTTSLLGSYSIELADLQETFMFPVDIFTVCSKGTCSERTVWVEALAKHSDVTTLLVNEFYKPSFEYQLTFAVIGSDKLVVYTDDTFVIKTIHTSYIRYPHNMDVAGYTRFDGTDSEDVDCELPAYLEDELLDITVQDLALNTENQAAAQASQIRISTNE